MPTTLHATKVLQKAAVHGYTTAFTVSALLLAAAALVAGLLIRASREKIQPEAQLAHAPVFEVELAVEVAPG